MKELIEIQYKLNAPKGQYNSFGKYNYRSAEDILNALKPLLHEHKCFLTITDEIVSIGDRFYIRATAMITNSEKESIAVQSLAREDENVKGMASSQVTGATSSYARKYALNGLFCIDDNKDADATNTHGKEDKSTASQEKQTMVKDSKPFEAAKKYVKGGGDIKDVEAKWILTEEIKTELCK